MGVDDPEGVAVEPDPPAERRAATAPRNRTSQGPRRGGAFRRSPAAMAPNVATAITISAASCTAPGAWHPVEDGHHRADDPEGGRRHRGAIGRPPPRGAGLDGGRAGGGIELPIIGTAVPARWDGPGQRSGGTIPPSSSARTSRATWSGSSRSQRPGAAM